MSNNMVFQQFPDPGSQGQLETVTEKLDTSGQMGLTELGTNGPSGQHVPISNMQMEQMYTTNLQASVSDPMPVNLGSRVQIISSEQSSYIDPRAFKPQWQPFLGPKYSSGGTGAMLSDLGSPKLLGKRKSPMEPMTNGSAAQKLSMPYNCMEQMENRPWPLYISSANNGPLQMKSTSVSQKMQHLPTLYKKTMQLESGYSKSEKQTMNIKQSVQAQPSPKAHNNSSESVRSKMRESLATALALVQQGDGSAKGEKNTQTKAASSPGKTQLNSQHMESASAASGSDASVAEKTTQALPTSDEVSVQKDSDGQISVQETSTNNKTSDTNQSDGQKPQFNDAFPQDDFSFSHNIFSNDELLQGNGLAWVLDPVTDFGEKKDNGIAEAHNSGDEKVGKMEGEQSGQNPELLALKIEMELFKLFGGVNKKYKEKGRSLLFNLKDKNNPELRERVVSGEILPERLCSMTAEELASEELSQWRQAKAQELAQMVVLPDTEVDIRRLVKKTHKGEFEVEFEPVDSGAMDVCSGISSFSQPREKVTEKEFSLSPKSVGKKEESSNRNTRKDQGTSGTISIPSNEGTDPMQGLSVDDEMKDAEFLPPIVSLDEFMESLNSEPPFGSLPEDAGKEAPVPEKSDLEVGSDSSKPSQQTPKEPIDYTEAKSQKSDVSSPTPVVDVKHSGSSVKSETTPYITAFKGERIWDGLLQISISSVTSVIGIFKSGEKTPTSEWPALLEVKGKVKVDAFGKFLQELPMSRSRAVMVMYLVCKEGISKSQPGSLFEVADAYIADGRVGFAEPASGVELYLCPPHGKILDFLSKIISKNQFDDSKILDNGLIGVVVWRRTTVSPRTSSRHKPSFKRQHSTSKRPPQDKKNTSPNVNFAHTKPSFVPNDNISAKTRDDAEDDDDVPPGFGPGAARDDDDLPEFNFSLGEQFPSRAPSQPRSVDQVRELIQRYGKSTGGISSGMQSWNNADDDDDDIPEWQPQAPQHQVVHPAHNYPAHMVNQQVHGGTMARPSQPQHSEGWWAHQDMGAKQYYGTPGGVAPSSTGGF